MKENKIKSSCHDIWPIVNPNTNEANEYVNAKICVCAAFKLNPLAKDKENYTDKKWHAKLNEIAATC